MVRRSPLNVGTYGRVVGRPKVDEEPASRSSESKQRSVTPHFLEEEATGTTVSFWIAGHSAAIEGLWSSPQCGAGVLPVSDLDGSFHVCMDVPCCFGLLVPTLNVNAHHQEPQHQRYFREEGGGQIVGRQIVYERQ